MEEIKMISAIKIRNLANLSKKSKTKYLSKKKWLLILICTSIFGNIIYMLAERKKNH